MRVYALTGPTGLLCENLLYEILKNNLDDLGQIKVFALGRSISGRTLKSRIAENLLAEGWRYLMPVKDPDLIALLLERITAIHIDLSMNRLGMSAEDFRSLNAQRIDHFIHAASITDFRNTPAVVERLRAANIDGGNRILELIGSFGQKPGTYSYVSSAYASGNSFGKIGPDYIRPDKNFRNVYEDTKLTAEVASRDFCRKNGIEFRVFRPSTLGGRLLEAPIGYVNKYDVHLGWLHFFVTIKRILLGKPDWETVFSTPVEIPVRIQTNAETGLNIVSADFAAKVIYQAVTHHHPATHYHTSGLNTIPMNVFLGAMLDHVNVHGYTFVSEPVKDFQNEHERRYYETVGKIYTPYIAQTEHSDFDCTSMTDVCRAHDIPVIGIDTVEKLILMVDFAIRTRFGSS